MRLTRVHIFRQLSLCLLVGHSMPVMAQENGGSGGAILTMSGTGSVAIRPDMATVSIGVEVTGPTADRALRANSAQMNKVLEVLRGFGLEEADIRTQNLGLNPRFRSRQNNNNEALQIIGFVVSNTLNVRVRDLPKLGAILDGVVQSGANRIFSIRFDVSDPNVALDRARAAAVVDARHKAEIYAQAAGVAIGPLLSLSEGGGAVPQYRERASALAMDAVPVAEAEVEISATVVLRFAIK